MTNGSRRHTWRSDGAGSSWRKKLILALLATVLASSAAGASTPTEATADASENRELVIPDDFDTTPPRRPVDGDVPANLYLTEDLILEQQVEAIDLESWNQRRQKWGFPTLSEAEFERNAAELIESDAMLGLAVVGNEKEDWAAITEQSVALVEYHEVAATSPGYLDAEIDERLGTLTVWTADPKSIQADTPTGVTIIETMFSRSDIEEFIEKTTLALAKEGLLISTSLERAEGLQLGFYSENFNAVKLEERVKTLIADLAAIENVSFSVEINFEEPLTVEDTWCDQPRLRCDNVGGGVRWGSCSSGFVVHAPNSEQRGVTTAGHCGNVTNFPIRGTFASGPNGLSEFAQLFFNAPLEQDDRFMDLQIGFDHVGDSGVYTASYYRDQNYGNQPITSVTANPPRDLEVCKSGRNHAGRLCGPIEDEDYDNGTTTQNALRIDFFGGSPSGGDSGGSITQDTAPRRAIGSLASIITSGSNASDGVAYRADLFPIYMDGWEVLTASNTARGLTDSFAARLYRQALGRFASVSEVNGWSSALDSASNSQCTTTAKSYIYFFLVDSGELNGLDNEQKVRRMFWTAFNRAPDSVGEDFWVDALDNGSWTWANAVNYNVYSVGETTTAIESRVGTQEGPC